MNLSRPATISAVFLLALIGLVGWWLMNAGVFRSPEAAMKAFLSPGVDVAEDQLADPLILTGRRAVPTVAEAIRNKALRYRRYAIGYLEWAGDERALPALEEILTDTTELDYFRADALRAIACIRVPYGDSLAGRFVHDSGALANEASQVFDGPFCFSRSFGQALFGVHE